MLQGHNYVDGGAFRRKRKQPNAITLFVIALSKRVNSSLTWRPMPRLSSHVTRVRNRPKTPTEQRHLYTINSRKTELVRCLTRACAMVKRNVFQFFNASIRLAIGSPGFAITLCCH